MKYEREWRKRNTWDSSPTVTTFPFCNLCSGSKPEKVKEICRFQAYLMNLGQGLTLQASIFSSVKWSKNPLIIMTIK